MASGNRITTTGVLYINGAQVENTFNNISKLTRKLESDLKKLTPGTDEFIETSKQLAQAQARFSEVKNEINSIKNSLQDTAPEIRSFGDLSSHISESFISALSATDFSFKSLGSGIRVFALQASTAISSIPIVGWIAAAVGAIGLGVKEIFDFNNQFAEANKLTQQITQLQDEQLDRVTNRAAVMEKAFGFDKKETIEVARNLVENFKVTYDEAMDQIERGAIKGGAANGEFIDSLREYPVFFQKAGFSLGEFVDIVNAGYDLGVYSDKLPDAIKEFDLSMREQTTATRDALVNAFGVPFADELLNRVSKGQTTIKDALLEVNAESEKYNLTQKQQAQLTADIFRGAGEDVGGFAKIMDAVTLALIEQGGPLTDIQQMTKDQIDLDNELASAKTEALKSDKVLAFQKTMENFWTKIQTVWYKFIGIMLEFGAKTIATVDAVIISWNILPSTVGLVFKSIAKDFSGIGQILTDFGSLAKDVFTFNWDNVDNSAAKFQNSLKNSFNNTINTVKGVGKTLAGVFVASYDLADKDIQAKATAQRLANQKNNENKSGNNFDGTAGSKNSKTVKDNSEKERKALEKELEESLKLVAEAKNKEHDLITKAADEKFKIQTESLEKELAIQMQARENELFNLMKAENEILAMIVELERKKSEAKNPLAKANYQIAIEQETKNLTTQQNLREVTEETHLFKLQSIREKYEARKFERMVAAENIRINASRRADEDEINKLTSLEEAKLKLQELPYLKLTDLELRNVRDLETARNLLREEANRKMLDAQLASFKIQEDELVKTISSLTNGEAKTKLLTDLEALKDKITQVKGAMNGNSDADNKAVVDEGRAAMDHVDLLGFSATQWSDMFDNLDTTEGKLKLLQAGVQALSNAFSLFNQIQQGQNQRELSTFNANQDKKKQALLKQLNEGYISQEEYHKGIQSLEAETDRKKNEIAVKQAKMERAMAVAQIAINTASAIMSIWAQVPKFDFGISAGVLTGIVSALGVAQAAAVLSQPLPSFAEGGFFEGYTGSSSMPVDFTGERPVGLVQLHEKEWTAPRWMTQSPRLANTFAYLESVRKNKAIPMAEGGYLNPNQNSTLGDQSQNFNNADYSFELVSVLSEVRGFLQKLSDEGVMAYIIEDAENGKKILRMIKSYEKIEQRASRK